MTNQANTGEPTGGAHAPEAADGYRPGGTLPLTVEIRRQLSRRRTLFAFALLILLPLGLAAAFTWGSDEARGGGGFYGDATLGAANFTVFTLAVCQTLLLPVIVALFFGDSVASEAHWGSLRYLLAIPVPRSRLLGVKVVVSLLSSVVAFGVLAGTAVLVGAVAFGWNPLRTPTGGELPPEVALLRVALMLAYILLTLLSVAGLASWLSVSTNAPLAAVGGAVMLVVVSGILDQVAALGDLRSVLPTHYVDAWQGLFTDPLRMEDMAKGATSALVYATVFFAVSWWHFSRTDVLS